MAQWHCPDCEGGFPTPATTTAKDGSGVKHEVKKCPWCGQVIGQYDTALGRVLDK